VIAACLVIMAAPGGCVLYRAPRERARRSRGSPPPAILCVFLILMLTPDLSALTG
jgi:hypothetical protein